MLLSFTKSRVESLFSYVCAVQMVECVEDEDVGHG